MSDFWADLATAKPAAVATTPAPRPRQARAPSTLGKIPLADAWVIFRASDDGMADDVRVVAGSHLNRLRPGEPRDWSHDIHLAAFAPTGPAIPEILARDAWQGFLQAWPIDKAHIAEAMRQAAQVEGLEWLHAAATRVEEAVA